MYIFGGFIAGDRTNQLIIYTFKGSMWSRVKTEGAQPSARNGHSACIYNNCIYIFGGNNKDNKKLNDIWKYEILKQVWTEIEIGEETTYCVPPERSGHSCDIYGQYMVIFGGFYEITKELNDLYLFDFINEKWIPIFIEENSPVVKTSPAPLNQPYNDPAGAFSMNMSSGVSSQLAFNKPLFVSSNNLETMHSTTIENQADPYNLKNNLQNSNRI